MNRHQAIIMKVQKSPKELAKLLCKDKCKFCILQDEDCNMFNFPCQQGIESYFKKNTTTNPMPELRKGDIVTTEDNVVWICNSEDTICRQGIATTLEGRLQDFLSQIIRVERYVLPLADVFMDFGKYDCPEPQKVTIWKK